METILFNLFLFFVGGCLASFCNCAAYRIPRKMNWVSGRSICTHCGRELTILELFPVLSCLVLHARCHYCKAYFGWHNCITEVGLGIIYITFYNFVPFVPVKIFSLSGITIAYFLVVLFLEENSFRKR